jgi:hypothetical protein
MQGRKGAERFEELKFKHCAVAPLRELLIRAAKHSC